MIKVSDVSKSFGRVKAVESLNFIVGKGEIVGFLGPNGAGKTTTMRLLTGFYSADMGKIEMDGVNIDEAGLEVRRKIGYLPENNPVYAEMLVGDYLELAGRISGMDKGGIKRGLDFVVEAMAIADVYYRPIRELSKGYKQRVGMAAAMIHDPEVLIMDEPTEGLDPNQRKEIRSLIRDLARKRTIILSTHVMGEAQALVNRVVVINRGRIVADGKTEELERGKEAMVRVELSGKRVITGIREMGKGLEIETLEKVGDKVELLIKGDRAEEIVKMVNNAVMKNKWMIWKLTQQERSLEDVFSELTEN